MRKERLIKCIEDGLKHILALKPGISNDDAINAAVERFIAEEVSRFSASELLSRFDTMEKGLTRFLDYLEHQTPAAQAVFSPSDSNHMKYCPGVSGYSAATIAADLQHAE
ncbi:MAG: hypothetical protein SWH61_14420 [Thermodesulfobacteriota bacterium]|nr:hypothetical protein [Thermodesulfobacteriota bacterium]